MAENTSNVTEKLVDFVTALEWDALPDDVKRHCVLGVANIVGCMLGGGGLPEVTRVDDVISPFSGPGDAVVVGTDRRRDPLSACLLNAMSGSVRTYDDTHAQAVVHASATVASVLLSAAYCAALDGKTLLAAYAAGVEVGCRLSLSISVPPGASFVGWSQTGICSAIAATVAAVKALGGDERALHAALTASSGQAAGLRSAQGSFASSFTYGNAAHVALRAALLGCAGFTGHRNSLEGPYGFLTAFAQTWSPDALVGELGQRFEIRRNLYKPYPCGIVIHSIIDACLALQRDMGVRSDRIRAVHMRVNPMVVALTDRRHPASQVSAQVSCYHWAAACLHSGEATLSSVSADAIENPHIRRLRDLITLQVDEEIPTEGAEVAVILDDGSEYVEVIRAATGSVDNPMSESQIRTKFLSQATFSLSSDRAANLYADLMNIDTATDMRTIVNNLSTR